MVGRPTDIATAERIYECVSKRPGCSQSYIAQELGLDIRNLNGRLASMEGTGFLLCEDGRRRLFPHSRRGILSNWLMENMT